LAFGFRHSVLLSGIASAILTTQVANAETKTRYESALLVPWGAVTDALAKVVGESDGDGKGELLDVTLPPQQFVIYDVPFEMSGINLKVSGQITKLPDQNETIHWKGDPLNIEFNVQPFEISKIVEQWVDGVQVRVHLKASCGSISLSQQAAVLDVGINWKAQGGELSAEISETFLNWPAGSWRLGPISCQGPKGFADVIERELKAVLSDPTEWTDLVQAQLEDSLNRQISLALEKIRHPRSVYTDDQSQIKIHFSGVQTFHQQGLLLKGFLLTKGDSVDLNSDKVISMISAPSLDSTQPTLLISDKEVARLVSLVSAERELRFDLTQISSFKKFLSYRFFQFFIWPDLLNFSKNAHFPVISRLNGPPVVVVDKSQIKFKSKVNSWVYARRNQASWRYIDMKTDLSAELTPKVQNGRLVLEFNQKRLNSSAKMAPEYSSRFRPRSTLPMAIINQAVERFPSFQSIQLSLPKIEITSGLAYEVFKLQHLEEGLIAVELK
jgi:hypothetical protein